jgi:2-polyprenyl-6-methoxyphenol hydroxylase-like FAD-dependent oxidoreductase
MHATTSTSQKNKALNIGIIGGGPAGLYFALLMKKHNPAHQIQVVEQNPPGATYGWGVVFSDRALSFLRDSNLETYEDVKARSRNWDDLTIVHKDEHVRIDGSSYSSIGRLALLQILQEHCRRYGVHLQFETRLFDTSTFAGCDLIVGADGVNSVVRQQFAEHLQPSTRRLANKYIWYGTHQLFDTLSLIFRSYQGGAFVAHCYPYSDTTSTFIVECDAETWRNAGFEHMSPHESRAYCEQVFRDDLGGHPLLSNNSIWMNFKVATNQQWSHRNVVLLGDALRTVHFSIGSGTRMALEDALALYHACNTTGDVPEALQAFEQARRPGMEKVLDIAEQSYTWYETFHEKMDLEPLQLVYNYMTRSGRITDADLWQKAPRFMARYQSYTKP